MLHEGYRYRRRVIHLHWNQVEEGGKMQGYTLCSVIDGSLSNRDQKRLNVAKLLISLNVPVDNGARGMPRPIVGTVHVLVCLGRCSQLTVTGSM